MCRSLSDWLLLLSWKRQISRQIPRIISFASASPPHSLLMKQADVYSWAMTTYEMLTETKPFAKMHKLEHLSLVCVSGKRPSLSHYSFPPALVSIIRSAWGSTVKKRPNIQEIVRKLERLIPELGDESACSWPTVEPDSSEHLNDNEEAFLTDDDDDLSLENLLLGSDGDIDEEMRKQVEKSSAHGIPAATLGDFDDNENSMSSIMYGEH